MREIRQYKDDLHIRTRMETVLQHLRKVSKKGQKLDPDVEDALRTKFHKKEKVIDKITGLEGEVVAVTKVHVPKGGTSAK